MAQAEVFLFLVFSFRLAVVPLAGHLVAAAAAAEHEGPAFFLFDRALHPPVLHQVAERPVDEIQAADPRRVARVHLRPLAAACRTVCAPVAYSVRIHLVAGWARCVVVVLASDHVLVAAAYPAKLTAV